MPRERFIFTVSIFFLSPRDTNRWCRLDFSGYAAQTQKKRQNASRNPFVHSSDDSIREGGMMPKTVCRCGGVRDDDGCSRCGGRGLVKMVDNRRFVHVVPVVENADVRSANIRRQASADSRTKKDIIVAGVESRTFRARRETNSKSCGDGGCSIEM